MSVTVLALSLLLLLGVNNASNCFDSNNYKSGDYSLTSENGYLNLNSKRFNLKGTSWFGFETSTVYNPIFTFIQLFISNIYNIKNSMWFMACGSMIIIGTLIF